MKKPKFKITNEVYRKIKELAAQMPSVPHFIVDSKGQHIPAQCATAKRIMGKDLIDQDPTAKDSNKAEIDPSKPYIQRGREIRMMNHKVALCQSYEATGEDGIVAYKAYVQYIHAQLSKPKEISVGTSAPKREDFGWVEKNHIENGVDGMLGEWTQDGGEQTYYKAMAEWEEINKPKDLSTTEK